MLELSHALTMRTRDLPRWYEVTYLGNPPGIRVAVHPDVATWLVTTNVDKVYAKGHYRTVEDEVAKRLPALVPFSLDTASGFGGCLQPVRDDHGWPCWEARFPRISTGMSDPRPYWEPALALGGSLAELLEGLNACAATVVEERLQAFSVTTCMHLGFGGGSIGATVSDWWAGLIETQLADPARADRATDVVIQAMYDTFMAMHGGKDEHVMHWENAFLMERPYRLIFRAPGDASTLHYDFDNLPRDGSRRHSLDCHNVDSAAQQFALLAGLARLRMYLEHGS